MSLKKQTYKSIKIIIIDDGSTDGTEEMLRTEFPEVEIIKGDGNLWWTKATNLGVQYALDNKADYILTLNNDVVLFTDYIEKMIFWAEKEPSSIFGSFEIDANSRLPIYGGEIINWKLANSKYLIDILNPQERHGIHPVNCIPARGCLIPTVVFEKIGLFDNIHLRHYLSDYDFTVRALKAGFDLFCNFDAKIYAFPEESQGIKFIHQKNFHNFLKHIFSIKGAGNVFDFYYFAIKNCPKKYLALYLPMGLSRRVGGYLIDWLLSKWN